MGVRRASFVAGLGAVTAAVSLAATAYACTALATLSAPPMAPPAGTVAVTGTSFAPTGAGPVLIHWNGVSGPVVGRAVPDAKGAITASVAVPKTAAAGQYVLVATQEKAGKPVYGTPARASLAVTAPDGTAPASPTAVTRTQPSSTASGGGLGLFTVALGAAGLALAGAGVVASRQRRPAPAAARRR